MIKKVGIVDDHQLFREGICALLSKHEEYQVVINAQGGKDLFSQLVDQSTPDVLLLDLTMPEMSGFEVLRQLNADYPSIRTIAISMHDDGNYMVQSVREKACGYLLKNADEEELLKAIDTVFDGGKYFNQDIAQRMIGVMSQESEEPKNLSPKEIEILALIADGQTTKEIAERLFVSTRTVETHRANMMKKLNVKNTAELIKRAVQFHLL